MTTATATALINAFAAASGTGAWPSLNRATLAKQLNSKLATPDLVNQAQTPFCGAAAFVRALVISKPDDYAQAAIDLFSTGEAKIGSLSIKPGNTTRNSAPQKSTDQADWLMLAGIRDSGNTLLSAAGLLGGNAAGITLPGTLAEWFTSAGFTVINKCDVLQTIPVVRACQITEANNYRSSHHVILFIDENVMEATNQADETSMYPDHWVTLTTPITDGGLLAYNDAISLSVHSWGGIVAIPTTPPLQKKYFLNKFYGYLAVQK